MIKNLFFLGFIMLLGACAQEKPLTNRWYTHSQLALGHQIYTKHCQNCHFEKARGTTNWKTTDEAGFYPPPPLDGTAHAWHHSLEELLFVVNEGGKTLGGKMPGFKEELGPKEAKAVIAYIQSIWSDETYQKWENRLKKSTQPFEGFNQAESN